VLERIVRAIGRSGRARRRSRPALPALLALGIVAACQSASPNALVPAPTALRASDPAGAGAAATPAPSAAPPQQVTLAVPAKSLAYLPYFLGLARGMYAAEGIDLQIQVMPSNLAVAAMTAGELAYTGSSGSSIQAAVSGQPFKVVLIMVKDLAFTLVAAPDVASAADLRGKSVAITSISASDDYALRAILRGQGVPEDEVTAVAAQGTANSFAALSSGAVQGAMLSPPFDVQAESLGFHPLASAADYLRRAQSGLATTDRQLATRPDEVRRMIRATLRSIDATLDDARDSTEFIASEFGVAPDLAPGTYEKIARVLSRDGAATPELVRGEIEDAKARLGLGDDVPIAQVVDFAPLEQAQRELGLR